MDKNSQRIAKWFNRKQNNILNILIKNEILHFLKKIMICKSEIVKNTIGKKFLVLLFKPDSFVVQFTSHISDMIIYRNIRKIVVFLISKDVKMAYLLSRYKFLKK